MTLISQSFIAGLSLGFEFQSADDMDDDFPSDVLIIDFFVLRFIIALS